jgi:hypothetical protein
VLLAGLLAASQGALVVAIVPINASSPGGRYADPLARAALRPEAAPLPADGFWAATGQIATAYRSLLARLEEIAKSPRIRIRVIGVVRYARESYPMVAIEVSPAPGRKADTRVLLTASVHGNERAGGEAVIRFAESLARSPDLYPSLAADLIPAVNPWGWVYHVRQNGAGKDVNRDFATRRTQEAALVRGYVQSRAQSGGAYDIALDHHESSQSGYFVYQYVNRRSGLGPAFVQAARLAGGPVETMYREGAFAVRDGVLAIPRIALPYVKAFGRLSLEQYVRLSGTRHAYTLESPMSDAFTDRVRVHHEAIRAMIALHRDRQGLPD